MNRSGWRGKEGLQKGIEKAKQTASVFVRVWAGVLASGQLIGENCEYCGLVDHLHATFYITPEYLLYCSCSMHSVQSKLL